MAKPSGQSMHCMSVFSTHLCTQQSAETTDQLWRCQGKNASGKTLPNESTFMKLCLGVLILLLSGHAC